MTVQRRSLSCALRFLAAYTCVHTVHVVFSRPPDHFCLRVHHITQPAVGDGTAYVTDAKNHDVRTEGMGYAMMAFVQLNNQTAFDMIWGWVQKHLYHGNTSDPLYGWSAWHASPNGTVLTQGPAPDGETW